MNILYHELIDNVLGQTEDNRQLAQQLSKPFQQLLLDEQISPQQLPPEALVGSYLPIAQWLFKRNQKTPHFIGVNGAQGSGKSTLCKILAMILQEGFNQRVVTLSIDDLYLTQAERKTLSQTTHPLLITRGVPGSHDVSLGLQLFKQLRETSGTLTLPQFDKSQDDRAPQSRWPEIELPVDMVLFEGWCVGTQPQSEAQLIEPINALERDEDSDGKWRRYVNQQLTDHYPALFEQLDTLLMIEIPDFDKVVEWRSLQEQKLRQQPASNTAQLMDNPALNRFIMHYERLTRANLAQMPQRADLLLKLDDNHQISAMIDKASS